MHFGKKKVSKETKFMDMDGQSFVAFQKFNFYFVYILFNIEIFKIQICYCNFC